jgi:hypothetical protein
MLSGIREKRADRKNLLHQFCLVARQFFAMQKIGKKCHFAVAEHV